MFLTAAFLSCHSRFFWGIKIYRKMAKITIYFYQKLFSQFSHQYLVFCRSNDKDKNGTKIAKRKKRLLNLTRSVTFSSILVSTNSQFTIRKKRHQTLQCSILIAVISRLQYTNSLPSTNFTSLTRVFQKTNRHQTIFIAATSRLHNTNIFGPWRKQPNIGSGTTYYRKFFLSLRAPRNQLRGDMRKFSVKLRRVKTRS